MINTNHQIFVDTQFKDNSPEKTVAHIKALLASYGIEAVESWHETSVPYCYALSVYIEGTTFSVNGKGLSKKTGLSPMSKFRWLKCRSAASLRRMEIGIVCLLSASRPLRISP